MAKIETPRPIRGTQDMIGDSADRFAHVVETFERVRKLYGFKRIEVPVFEATAVFSRSLGETTDVVSKEMYSFEDRGGDSLTLRPEFTAGIARAYITEGWQQYAPLKVATHGPLFRYERPQKGRYRQFHQIDAEIIGAAEPLADAELLIFADQLLKELGISEGVTLTLNTLGDYQSREEWRSALVAYFEGHRDQLSDDSKDRLHRNPLRILDSKDPRDQAIVAEAPDIDAYLTEEAQAFFEKVTDGLKAAGVAWTRNARLVRGLDYYRHTAFEFVTDRLGAQGTVLGGGRYDGLIETLGGPSTPAVGWAAGIERLGMLLDNVQSGTLDVVIAVEDDRYLSDAMKLAALLRQAGLSADLVATGSPRKRYDKATKIDAQVLLSLRDKDGAVAVREHSARNSEKLDGVKAILAGAGYAE
ncbi:MAG: histidine--tRNA ligase [Alphaproteobacteria bacterium]|nr:histidine--tRNA ligase [Alphaproteobacteria bacterium]MBU0795325.1 histidine--tRNA ligase [Alphaproteobacteria bacterium]MBU0877367.1 histidine--tRNA ligase [Alphaproteobacteria bacterium]MBU1770638.1 histidine--tRNA ligase [Alphaproteobacteria bacterium]